MTDPLRDQLQAALGATLSIERELGGGGMSRVFVARDAVLGRNVVVKVFASDIAKDLSLGRFAREIRMAAGLQEPHIVPVLTAGETADGLPYYTMPFVRGESLRVRMDKGAVPLIETMGILRDVARALAHAHAQGIVHRDIKPENILLSEGTAVVVDFGIAKAISDARTLERHPRLSNTGGQTIEGTSIGTPAYMSPEQASADPNIDHRADLYSWGIIAYEMLAGQHPFAHRKTMQQMFAAQVSEIPKDVRAVRPEVPPGLAKMVMRCLEKDPSQRPDSARELVASLEARPSIARRVVEDRSSRSLAAAGIIVVAVVIATVFGLTHRGAASATGADASVAVMPFTVIGRDSTEQYLADGMSDELANELTRVNGLRVAARRSAFSIRNGPATPSQLGKLLHVSMLLDGTVQRVGDRIRVHTQLTSTENGDLLWGQTFEGSAREVFALQDTITHNIVEKLRLRFAVAAAGEWAGVRPKNLDAHDLYLRGRFEAARHTEAGLNAALGLYQQAIGIDSMYALPYVGMADAYGWLADAYLDPATAYTKAKTAVTRGIALAPSLAEGHAVLAWILMAYEWNFSAAEAEARRAVSLDSTSALARSNHAYTLMYLRRPNDAVAEMRRAFALDPLTPAWSSNLEWHLLMARQYQAVVDQHAVTMRLDPGYFFGDSWAAAALRELQRYDESVAEYKRVSSVTTAPPFGLAVTYAKMGDSGRARDVLRQLLTHEGQESLKPTGIAQMYVALGDADKAMEWLERAYRAHTNAILDLPFSAAYDPIRKDPRFVALERRIGF